MQQAMPTPGNPWSADTVEPTLARYLRQLLELPGMVSCCVFDVAHHGNITRAVTGDPIGTLVGGARR